MGDSTQSGVRVYKEAEVTHLSSDNRRKLEEHVLKQIENSQEIRDLLKARSKPFLDSLR
jgi:hypothetical protein